MGTFHFFERDYSYLAYGNQATYLANNIYHTLSVIKKENGLDSISFSKKLFAKVVFTLLDSNFCIHVWRKGTGVWEKFIEASPGNISELDQLSGITSCQSGCGILGAVHVDDSQHPIKIGLAVANTSYNFMTIMNFSDTSDFRRCLVSNLLLNGRAFK